MADKVYNQSLISKLKYLKEPYSLIVKGTSMYPYFVEGQKVTVKSIESPDEINIGDIIIYNKFSTHLTIHRVINKMYTNNVFCYQTKGDNNQLADSYVVAFSDIVGKFVDS